MARWTAVSRGLSAGALALVAAGCMTVVVLQSWLAHAVLDDDRFAAIAVRVLEQDEVRLELRRVIVDQAILQQPDLVAARPLLEAVVDTVIGSRAFDPILAEGARQLHYALFNSDRQTVVLDVSDAMTLAIAALRAYDADLAERVPGGPNVGSITIGERNAATSALEVDRRLQAFRWVFVTGALLSLVAAVALAPDRSRIILVLGTGLVGGALVVWFAVGLAADALADSVRGSPIASTAARAIWDTYTDGLVWWMWAQALIGVMLATVAGSTTSTRPVHVRTRQLAELLSRAWERRLVRVVLAASICVSGLFVLLAPGPSTRLLAQGLGLSLLYFGGAELLRGLGLARTPSETAPAGARWPLPRPTFVQGLSGAVLVLALAAGVTVFWFNRDALTASPASARPEVERCNGLASLCDRRLDEAVFATTHNSMAAADEPGWFFASQYAGIPEQLNDGVRALMLDVYYGFATNQGVRTDPSLVDIAGRVEAGLGAEAAAATASLVDAIGPIPAGATPSIYLCHAYCELGATPFEQTLRDLRVFLDEHPNEVVLLILQDYVMPRDVEAAFVRATLTDYVYTLEPGTALPTLGEMIELDDRLLVLSERRGAADAPAWYHDAYSLLQETPYEARVGALNCDPARGAAGNPLFLLNHWIARTAPSPEDATVLNGYDLLMDRVHKCQEERGLLPNLIAVNFYEVGDVVRVVHDLNAEE